MVTLTAQVVGAPAVAEKLEAISGKMRERLRRAVRKSAAEVQGAVKAGPLTGGALDVRTGRLRRSITTAARDEGETLRSVVGTNVEYARVHELGFSGSVSVQAHDRTMTQAFGRRVAPFVQHVRSHSRNANIPPRPFLQPTLRALSPSIVERIRRAVGAADGR
jgi:phage gpG-like protein